MCIASASMMSESLQGRTVEQIDQLTHEFLHWFDHGSSDKPSSETLNALDGVRQHSARKKCVMLAWNAMNDIVSEMKNQTITTNSRVTEL